MKLFLVVFLFAFLTLPALAAPEMPKINLYWRMDTVKELNYKDQYVSSADLENKENKEFKFTIPYIRVNAHGNYSDDISYRVGFRLNKTLAQKESYQYDESGQGLDYAYIDQKFCDFFKLRAGKQVFYHGGWNAAYSSKDDYSFAHLSFSYYAVGFGGMINWKDQQLIVQVLNSESSQLNQSKPLYGFQYVGKFFDGLINPLVSYHVNPSEEQIVGGVKTDVAANDTLIAIGNRLSIANFWIDTDYEMKNAESTTAGGKESKSTEMVFRLSYDMGKFKPQIKYAIAQTQENGAKSDKITNGHIALEYYPKNDGNFRYHAVYLVHNEENTAGVDRGGAKVLLGMAGKF